MNQFEGDMVITCVKAINKEIPSLGVLCTISVEMRYLMLSLQKVMLTGVSPGHLVCINSMHSMQSQ